VLGALALVVREAGVELVVVGVGRCVRAATGFRASSHGYS